MALVWTIALTANYVLVPFMIASVLRRRKEPMAMLAWILGIVFIPFIGMLLYWLMGSNLVVRRARRRRQRVAHLISRIESWTHQQLDIDRAGHELPRDLVSVARLGKRLSGMPATAGNEVRVYQESNETYGALEQAISGARHHIHLEYYIWQPDATGYALRDLVVEKAGAGVQCRLLLDSIGCWRLGRRFTEPLAAAGVQLAFFLPLRSFRWQISPHLRNHRKIAVVDGQVAFMGSQNIGDEYRGRLRKLSPWYDTHIRVNGPAALFLQRTFAEDWLFATREDLAGEEYFSKPELVGDSIMQILPTGPDQNVSPLEQIVFAAVSSAQGSIRITTPYFVPSPGLRMALVHAASRGVRVELLLPTRSDSTIMLWAGRSFYAELLEAGVRVYEYDQGVLHSKIVTVDERWCMLGSANMDVRSFRLNFEITALIYDPRVARELSDSIGRFRDRARAIRLGDVRQRRVHQQLAEGTARLLTPLL
ncbi:MAG: cardiolipin synthase [Planctomycetota bacterium]